MLVCLDENQLDMLRISLFQFLLQIATAVLILAVCKDLALKLLQSDISEAGIFWFFRSVMESIER